jgi:membrane-associated phospholipid phosphatase
MLVLVVLAGVTLSGGFPAGAAADVPEGGRAGARRKAEPIKPELSLPLEIGLLGAGSGLNGIGQLIHVRHQPVPLEGLDRSRITLALDRRAVGNHSQSAARASDWMVTASTAYPLLVSVASAPRGNTLRAPLLRLIPYLEASLLSDGATQILKRGVSRPRPYLYQSVGGTGPSERSRTDDPFLSFPSGHSSHAWCAAAFAVVDHALTRPRASGWENAAVGLGGGLVATTTGWLRVRAGQHFPSDVAAGAAVGGLFGAAVPLLHRYGSAGERAPMPPARSWIHSLEGVGAGTALVLLVAPLVSSN